MGANEFLKLAGGILALVAFVPLAMGAIRDNGAGQSFATWILWAALDWVLTASIIQQDGNYLMPLGFALGDAVMVGVLLRQRRFLWGRFETAVLAAVLCCLGVWQTAGPRLGTMAATTGICIAGIPGLIELWKTAERSVGNVWALYAIANCASYLGGSSMTVEERLAPGVFAVFSVLMFAASRRRLSAACSKATPI